ncbi:double-stranded RNA-binding protein 4-like, partial [Bidens hawaiensis]|uniref:double-stranded RNA-binding protein 4-like n=1 Tax=Bidens hawaiensis TaxID=980011 RepID=UPI004049111D
MTPITYEYWLDAPDETKEDAWNYGLGFNFKITCLGSKPDFMYKSLLSQQTQKLKKPPPIYQTLNEGPDHHPRFRSTVWVDGVSYTSSNTFPQRKVSEMDVSKIAYIALTQKAKTDALHFTDKTFCKSIIAEFAAKKGLDKPVYETTQLEAVPSFRSNLVFNGRTFQGESAKSKKEAEQSVARSVVVKYLDSEFGTDMADIVYCKMKQYIEMNKVHEINSVPSGSNVLGQLAGTSTVVPTTLVEPITPAAPVVIQSSAPIVPQLVEPITPAAPIVIQPPAPIVPQLVEPITPAALVAIQPPAPIIPQLVEPVTPAASVVIQPPATQVSDEPIHQDEPIMPVVAE